MQAFISTGNYAAERNTLMGKRLGDRIHYVMEFPPPSVVLANGGICPTNPSECKAQARRVPSVLWPLNLYQVSHPSRELLRAVTL